MTWVSNFYSNDEATVLVGSDGTVKALRAGETAVRVHLRLGDRALRSARAYDALEHYRAARVLLET